MMKYECQGKEETGEGAGYTDDVVDVDASATVVG